MWYKPNAPPLGAINRYRSAFDWILWFAKSKHPYSNLKACGQPSKRIGFQSRNRHGNIDGSSDPVEGIARPTNVIVVSAGSVDRDIDHPAMFPQELVHRLLLSHAPRGSLILDPFAGSGTTCLVAQKEGYQFLGFDNGISSKGERYADMANRRLRMEAADAGAATKDRSRLSDGESCFALALPVPSS